MTQDLTKITTPWGLLDSETREDLLGCGGPWQLWHGRDVWLDCFDAPWDDRTVYRKTPPEPREYVLWAVCRGGGERYAPLCWDVDVAMSEAKRIGGFVVKLTGTRDET